MSRPLIGQVLSRMGKLCEIDVDEILAEQALTRRRFGEIAVAWGLCEPEHICDAWCTQLAEASTPIDLMQVPFDLDAVECVDGQLARRLGVVPLRLVGTQLVVAAAHILDSVGISELVRAAGREVRLVRADPAQIHEVLDQFYPAAAAA